MGIKFCRKKELDFRAEEPNIFGYLKKEAYGMLGFTNRSSILGHLVA